MTKITVDVPFKRETTSVFNRSFTILSLFALLALLVLCALGSWQVKRLFWKEALLQRIEQQMAQSPSKIGELLPLNPSLTGTSNDLEYLPVTVKGRFLKDLEFFYYATLNGKVGYHLYAPLQLSAPVQGKKAFIFINRGFIPDNKKDASSRPETLTLDEVELEGLLRWPDEGKPNSFIPENDAKQKLFFWRDLDLMVKLSGLENETVLPAFIYVDKQESTGLGQLPVGGVSRIDFPNNHLAYAVTWYGLALTLVGVWVGLLITRFKAKAENDV